MANILRTPEVLKKLGGISTSTFKKLIKDNPDFPKSIKLTSRVAVFFDEEIDQWLTTKQ